MGQSNSVERNQMEADLDPDPPLSGIQLAPELEGAIVRDFQNQSLQQEWDKFRMSVLVHRNERATNFNQTQMALEQQRQARMAMASQRHVRLDQSIDALNAQFSDSAVALKYDASNLLQKFEAPDNISHVYDDIDKDSKPLPCLGPRAHWMDCQKKYAMDPRPCNAYVEALEKCVVSTVSKANP